jgi:hypothetical protein
MANRSADEIKAHNLATMGNDLGEVYSAIWQEIAHVYRNWGQYKDLYGTKPSRVGVANEAAAAFFGIVQDCLWESVLLHVSRLTDNVKSAGKPTLTIKMLPALMPTPAQGKTIQALVDTALADAAFCRDWRHRRIAHNDLDLSINPSATPLKQATRLGVDKALRSLAAVINEVAAEFGDGETRFDLGPPPLTGAVTLLHVLHHGLAARKQLLEDWKNGKISEEDYYPNL